MAGLPCESCQEPLVVVQTCGPTEDLGERVVLRRERVCLTPSCEFYRIRRQSAEVLLPLSESPDYVPLEHTKVRRALAAHPADRDL